MTDNNNENDDNEDTAPNTAVDWAMLRIPIDKKLFEGIDVMKVTTIGGTRSRVISLSPDRFTLVITKKRIKSKRVRHAARGVGHNVTQMTKKVAGMFRGYRYRSHYSMDSDDANTRTIDISSIERLQRGVVGTKKLEISRQQYERKSLTRTSSRKGSMFDSSNYETIISIIYNGKRSVNFSVKDPNDGDLFMHSIKELIDAYRSTKNYVGTDELLLRYMWLDMDKDKSGTISLKEASRILDRVNYGISSRNLKIKYDTFCDRHGIPKKRGLSFKQAIMFFDDVRWGSRPPGDNDTTAAAAAARTATSTSTMSPPTTISVDTIWKRLFGPDVTVVNPHDFLTKFVHRTQNERDVTLKNVEHLFVRFNSMDIYGAGGGSSSRRRIDDGTIGKKHFENYLLGRMNDVYDPKRLKFGCCDMNRPLSEYLINSSHNTYLTGDQLKSKSSTEMYMNALHRGCRCLEIDVWDGTIDKKRSNTPIPIVYHGHTITSKIKFRDVITVVHTFLTSYPESYPVVLSLENHCSHPFQETMVKDLRGVLGEALVTLPRGGKSEMTELPSPESLKGRVILKGSGAKEFEELEGKSKEEIRDLVKIIPELAEITVLNGNKFSSWSKSISDPTFNMHSFSETKLAKLLDNNDGDDDTISQWLEYNRKHMSRVYPAGLRVDSSNYDPLVAWQLGCQLVALNIQTMDNPLLINDGVFRQNGRCGYIPKLPPPPPPPSSSFHGGNDGKTTTSSSSSSVSIRVLSGHNLPKPKGKKQGECIDPYVKVHLYDVSENNTKNTHKSHTTKTLNDNGYCPTWMSSPPFEFSVVNDNVAVVVFVVWDADVGKRDDFIAGAAIPVRCLREGYRSVQVYDANNSRNGSFDFASLLVEIKFN